MKSEIGECVSVLFYKRWGKTLVGNKLRSKSWWENRLKELINAPTVIIENNTSPGIYNQDGTLQEPPIPFEKEMGLPEDMTEYWLPWLQQIFKKRYEHKTMA